MATLEELVLKIEADNKQLIAALEESAKVTARSAKQMEDSVTKFAENGSKETSKFSNTMSVFAGTVMANVAVKGFALAMEAAQSFFGLLADGISKAQEAEENLVRLGNSMAMSGNYTKDAVASLSAYADQMELNTAVEAEAITKNLALLSSMTRLDTEGLKRAQTSAINLSAAIGVDLATATKMVAKAAEGNTDAFKKYGIEIEGSTNKAQALENTLKTLEGRFGGTAAGTINTFRGSVQLLGHAFGSMFDAMGETVVKNPAIIAAMKELTKMFLNLKDETESAGPAIAKSIGQGLTSVIQVIQVVLDGVQVLSRTIQNTFNVIHASIQGLVDGFQFLGKIVTGEWDNATAVYQESGALWSKTADTASNELGTWGASLQGLADATYSATQTMGDSFKPVGAAIENQKKKTQELTWLEEQRALKAGEFATALAQQATDITAMYGLQQEELNMALESQAITEEEYVARRNEMQLSQFAIEQEQLVSALEAKKLTEEQYALASQALELQQHQQSLKLKDEMVKREEEMNKKRIAGYSQFFGNLASLQQTSSKELAAIGKAAAIAQATIDGYAAIQGAYKQGSIIGGPPLGAAFAAAAGAATAVNISKIAGVGLKRGIDSVPGVGSGDSFPAVLAPGERVVPAETNKDLTQFLEGKSEQKQSNVFNLNFYGPIWSDKASAGSDIVEAINEAIARGMTTGLTA